MFDASPDRAVDAAPRRLPHEKPYLSDRADMAVIENDPLASFLLAPEPQELPPDVAFLRPLGFDVDTLAAASERAARYDCSAVDVLVAEGVVSESDYWRAAADHLGVAYSEATPIIDDPVHLYPGARAVDRMMRLMVVPERSPFANNLLFLVPDMRRADGFRALFARHRQEATRIRVVPPSANRRAFLHRARAALLDKAVEGLRDMAPHLSSKRVITAVQAVALLLIIQIITALSLMSAGSVAVAFHLTIGVFYLACVFLRLYASVAVDFRARRPPPVWLDRTDRSRDHALPCYSVLVALYQEASQADDLIDALLRLDWPRERLEIMLVCEEDDHETIAAIETRLGEEHVPHLTVCRVPAAGPRTKPKALNIALAQSRGDYLVIYDAEDRPEPGQLREAHAKFSYSHPELVCLQAPLVIHNHGEGWLSRMFTLEYSALFDGLLPALARHNLPLPLGGTSNHFKRAVLEAAGGWDPFNVTEDADLGMRLSRMGYRISTLTRPTYEEAPIAFDVWLRQRTRWIKGWLQTWLVHMRQPLRLSRDLGLAGTLAFHLMITAMVISALVHPILLVSLVFWLFDGWQNGAAAVLSRPLFWFDVATIVLGYAAFIVLAVRTLPVRGLSHLAPALVGLPLYWPLISLAAWRAVWHLIRRPHEWEKTPHRLQSRRALMREAMRA